MALQNQKPRGWQRQVALNYLKLNPNATNEEVVKATFVSERTVSAARAELVAKGFMPRSPQDRVQRPDQGGLPILGLPRPLGGDPGVSPEDIQTLGMRELMESLGGAPVPGAEIDGPAMVAILDGFIRNNDNHPSVRMAAMAAKAKIKADLAGRDALGPGKPKTPRRRH
jgi:hypothetical protein